MGVQRADRARLIRLQRSAGHAATPSRPLLTAGSRLKGMFLDQPDYPPLAFDELV